MVRRWSGILIHKHRCNWPGWHGSKLVVEHEGNAPHGCGLLGGGILTVWVWVCMLVVLLESGISQCFTMMTMMIRSTGDDFIFQKFVSCNWEFLFQVVSFVCNFCFDLK